MPRRTLRLELCLWSLKDELRSEDRDPLGRGNKPVVQCILEAPCKLIPLGTAPDILINGL